MGDLQARGALVQTQSLHEVLDLKQEARIEGTLWGIFRHQESRCLWPGVGIGGGLSPLLLAPSHHTCFPVREWLSSPETSRVATDKLWRMGCECTCLVAPSGGAETGCALPLILRELILR